jgi:hypothetical protein
VERIVSPLYLAAGAVGVLRLHPSAASRLEQRHLRNPKTYDEVFSSNIPLGAWPVLVGLLKLVDVELERIRSGERSIGGGERFLKRWRYLVALIVLARALGKFSFGAEAVALVPVATLTAAKVLDAWGIVAEVAASGMASGRKNGVAVGFVRAVCARAGDVFEIADPKAVETNPARFVHVNRKERIPRQFSMPAAGPEFLDMVDKELPPQPWKPGVQRQVAEKLGCHAKMVGDAIQTLIASGRRNRQKDGIVYDREGNIIAVDNARKRSET